MSCLQTKRIKGGNELAWGFTMAVKAVLEWSLGRDLDVLHRSMSFDVLVAKSLMATYKEERYFVFRG